MLNINEQGILKDLSDLRAHLNKVSIIYNLTKINYNKITNN